MIPRSGYFTNNEVLFIGVSSDPKSFSRSIYNDFLREGIKVYALNKKAFEIDGVKVYDDIDALEKVPEVAYILLNKENTKKIFDKLKDKGIKKIMFQSKATVDLETIEKCHDLGIDTLIACPKMMVGKSPIHKIHGFFAGVR